MCITPGKRARYSTIFASWFGFGLCLFLATLTPRDLLAQNDTLRSVPDFYSRPSGILNPDSSAQTGSFWRKPVAVGLSTGTKGLLGIDLAIEIVAQLQARLGFSYLQYELNNYLLPLEDYGYGGEDLLFSGAIQQNQIELLLEFAFANDFLRLISGAAIHLDNNMSGEGILRDSLDYQDVRISPKEVGYVRGDVTFPNAVSPYLGIGIGRAIPRKRVGVSVEAGAFYRGEPQVKLQASNLLRNNINNEDALQEALSFWQWWPVLNLRLAYRFQ